MQTDKKSAVQHLLDLLIAEGPSGGEGPVAHVVKEKLLAAGCKPSWIRENVGNKRMAKHCTVGNLIVKIPGTVKGPRIMFAAHLDTVPICQGVIPVQKGTRIVPKGKTGLGGDNRASVAAIVSMIETVLKKNLPHPPLTLLFPVGEENGMHGSTAFQPSEGDHPALCFNLDGSGERGGVIGALGAVHWTATVHGKSVHAGVNPEGGISAAVIAAHAITDIQAKGYFGKIKTGRITGTANIGTMQGGEASNQVMDQLIVTGECRSHHPAALKQIASVWKAAFEKAARTLKNVQGDCGSVDWKMESTYRSFKLKKSEPVVRQFLKAAPIVGREAKTEVINAGLDANILTEKGIPTLTFDAGNYHAHDLNEYIEIPRYLEACELTVALATGE